MILTNRPLMIRRGAWSNYVSDKTFMMLVSLLSNVARLHSRLQVVEPKGDVHAHQPAVLGLILVAGLLSRWENTGLKLSI